MAEVHPEFVPTTVIAERRAAGRRLRAVLRRSGHRRGARRGRGTADLARLDRKLHMCLLSCEDHPGYLEALAAPVPGTAWLGHEGEPVTVGGLILGVFGLLLLFLAVSGLWLWWPRPGRYMASMTVRRGKGRFARDTNLHKVIGMIAPPLLLGTLARAAVASQAAGRRTSPRGWHRCRSFLMPACPLPSRRPPNAGSVGTPTWLTSPSCPGTCVGSV